MTSLTRNEMKKLMGGGVLPPIGGVGDVGGCTARANCPSLGCYVECSGDSNCSATDGHGVTCKKDGKDITDLCSDHSFTL